jgi:hypothetical protein
VAVAAAAGLGRDERILLEIIEFSCPSGHISHGRDALERVYEQKKNKYADLANEFKRLQHEQVRVTVVIVSSMSVVYGPPILSNSCRRSQVKNERARHELLDPVFHAHQSSNDLFTLIRITFSRIMSTAASEQHKK